MFAYAKTAKEGLKGIYHAGAGGSAHLPGMIASLTTLPVIGVPIVSHNLNGVDSLLSNCPDAKWNSSCLCCSVLSSINAAILACQILL